MADLAERLAETRDLIEPSWSPARELRLRHAVARGLTRQRRRRAGLVAVLGAAILVLGILLGRHQANVARNTVREAPVLARLVDGSVVTARTPDARVESIAIGPQAVTFQLDRGSARFSVTPNPERPFKVLAGDVTVTVLGTVFDVTIEPAGVHVSVVRGRVRVSTSRAERVLGAGDSGLFATPDADTAAAAPSAAAAAPASAAAVSAELTERKEPTAAPSWRTLAHDGSYAQAVTRLMAEGPNAVRDTPEDLLLSADVARLGGHPERAVAPLQRVISGHPFDSRAPLAAFTLGRTLLEQLGQPRSAARAFATARQLDRAGALTQDALAREVEAWSRAGESDKAHERALDYLKRYPNGRRASAVRRHGGVEETAPQN
jgi:transmembrane sensor